MTSANAPVRPAGPRASPTLATYYVLLATQTISQIGSQVSAYAVGISVFRSTGQATPLALVLFFQTAPFLLGGFFGAVADRFDRRRVMLVANLGFTATSALLLASFASGAFQLWQLYALTLGAALFGALERPAFQASVAMLVPEGHRDRANAIGQMTGPAAGVVAPAIAGMLYALVGVVGAIGIDIATFLVAIAVLGTVRIPRPPETAEGRAMRGSAWRQALEPGWRSIAWLVGAGPGAGIGMMFVVTGAAVLTLSLVAYAVPAVRRLEEDLPDYVPAGAE